MIPVKPQAEPATFDSQVRQPGRTWLRTHKLARRRRVPKGVKLPPYWRECLPELYSAYGGICAYLGIHFERITGAATADHYVAKSGRLSLAYEWSNFRLACLLMNGRKQKFDDVLDPFTLAADTFHLNLLDGSIRPNPGLSTAMGRKAQATIDRLKLDDAECRKVRALAYADVVSGDITADYLRRRYPFVWYEAKRQLLL